LASKLLNSHRAAILPRWFQLILESYPTDTSGSLQSESGKSLDPVESGISLEAKLILDEIEGGMQEDLLSDSLDRLMCIRSVQALPPSGAVGIIFLLKQAVREGLQNQPRDARFHDELQEIESRVDGVALMAFDRYMRQRELICEQRVREASERADAILARMYRVGGAPDEM
jgi:hypothetical protein